ncbi:MAG: enoyl-CoA hydratase [Rhodospirillaceae bacterium]|nr:enoyl-CoA hydratase [Rhodospirillaceae bacterium]
MAQEHQKSREPVAVRADKDGVAWITLNRPRRYNALSTLLMTELQKLFDQLANEKSIMAVVIQGAGKGFCAGHDLKEMKENYCEKFYNAFFSQCSKLMMSISTLPQPVIAKVHGTAAAAGCQLVASCDLAIASDDALFATPGINIGLFCSTPMVAVSRKVNRKKMMEMLLLGEPIDAHTAVDYGLINKCVPVDVLDKTLVDLTKTITDKSPLVLKIGKEAFYKQLEMPLAEAYSYTSRVMTENMLAKDADEGISAFIEKRSPSWTGK